MPRPPLVEFGTDDEAIDFDQAFKGYNTICHRQNPFVMLVFELLEQGYD